MTDRDPEVRAADEDRESVVSALREHIVAGRLDIEEFNRRIGRALEAPTLGDLDQLLADLPTIVLPTPTLKSRRQRAAVRKHQKALANWELTRETKVLHLDLARGGGEASHIEFPCGAGERILARIPQSTLRVWTTTPGHTERRTTTQYSRNVFGGGRRTGTTRTYQVPGRDVQVRADTGVLYVTNRRVGFRGPKRTVDTLIESAAGIKVEPKSRTIVVSLPKERPVTYRYPKDPSGHVAFSIQLALAHSQGAVSSLVSCLTSELAELDHNKPVLLRHVLDSPPKRSSMRRMRAIGEFGGGVTPSNQGSTGVATRWSAIRQSWWILLALPFGVTTWAAFWYAGRRAKRGDLLITAAGYAIALVVSLVLTGSGLNSAGAALLSITWIVGIIHILAVWRKLKQGFVMANTR